LIALCFFDNVDSGMLVFCTTPLLSEKTLLGPESGIPKHLSLILRAEIKSLAIRIATNSEPYVLDSHVFCRLLNAITGVLLSKINIPVCDHLVTLLPAWSASTKQDICTGFPRGTGMFGGSSSTTSP